MTKLLVESRQDGSPLTARDLMGNLSLLLIAGIDTTWSAIGSSLWHLAQHPEQQAQLREHPELWPQAVEELLRAYSPVMMGRVALDDTEIAGCPVPKGRRVLLSFPAANRDPSVFRDPDVVDFERAENRHVAFGSGIHRCAGSNIARMELRVALQQWCDRFASFSLDPEATTTWAGGQVRGPRSVPVVVSRG
jgi:cytochrome P450